MVAGDPVNTASRVQSAAEPGTVLVGEATRRATEQAIVYENAGEHELKGKAEPVALWRALRVVSGVGGTLESAGLEAPFVGRERELRLIKELFHALRPGAAGAPGLGDRASPGSASPGWRGSSTSTSTGSSTTSGGTAAAASPTGRGWRTGRWPRWCGCAAGSPRTSSRSRRGEAAATLRAPARPRGAGVRRAPAGPPARAGRRQRHGDREDLFAAWRLFFERLADTSPVVLVFEDMQWADTGLLDFSSTCSTGRATTRSS